MTCQVYQFPTMFYWPALFESHDFTNQNEVSGTSNELIYVT